MEALGVIWKWLAPLWGFISGFICLLISLVFLPAIRAALTASKAETASYQSHYWGLTWAYDSAPLWFVIFGIFLILLNVFTIWLKRR